MFERIYLEIGNICNLNCSFCAGTTKPKRQMTENEFSLVCQKIKGHTKFIYLHVMGEPLLHPKLWAFLQIANENNLKVCITTNGLLINKCAQVLLNSPAVYKISYSVHSLEGNDLSAFENYIENLCNFAKLSAQKGVYNIFRLWNKDSLSGKGKNANNNKIENLLHKHFSNEWQVRPKGFRLDKNVFLEYDGVFTWPTKSSAEECEEGFCYGLVNQLAILVDGTIVPCCLDANGEISLGNIYSSTLEEVLNGELSKEIQAGFNSGKIIHSLCKKCSFARKNSFSV